MATEQATQALRTSITEALAFREKSLESRAQWGSISFEKASSDFKRIFEILAHLSILPLEYLPDTAISQIQSSITSTSEVFIRIDQFNIEQQQTPTGVRDSLVSEIHAQADQLYHHASSWVSFLAYQKGDVAKNIETLTGSLTRAQGLVDEAKEKIDARQGEIETIITQAREASAAAGAAVFTQDFKNEASTLNTRATGWLKLTGALALLTLVIAAVMWFAPANGSDMATVVQRFGGRLAVLVVLFTATLWCGKTFNALMHLSTVNRHRALSLQTFQAFSHAASDDATKNAVLMETTRAIFGSVPTGFLDGKASGGDNDLRIVEVAKSLGAKGGT
jgi:hypothetical protein